MHVFVWGKNGKALMPCHPARARQLLRDQRAVVHRMVPFVIRLKDRTSGDTQPVCLKLDPGSKATGLALIREESSRHHVLFLAELEHRGQVIRDTLAQRRAFRRARRSRKTR